ncbi:MAG: amidohydrolase family protein [Gammaproteobacteria bacterium]|jgi:imidazolonepropionase-like amidohydrolase|nr:amidohydrolase family protein [Gammaproteobacteria bacterium]MBP6481937.1 amidohydrolase family protein [Pseudomonadales bacterium]
MKTTLIRNARIWDGTGARAFVGDLLIEGNRIRSVTPGGAAAGASADLQIDGTGRFLMPGMTEGHAHLSFDGVTCTENLITPPPEEHTLLTARVAKTLLDHGFTSAYGASAAKLRLDVAVRNEIDAGRLQGPRVRAGSLEITVTGGLGDESKLHNPRNGPSIVVDGAEEMRKAVRLCCREGCDNIKLDVSGDPFYPEIPSHATPMSLEEVRMAVATAHSFGKKVNAHARSIESIRHCLVAGVDVIYHAEYSDEETLDMLEAAKDRIFVAPTISLFHTMMHEAEPYLPRAAAEAMGIPALIEESVKTHTALRKRGIRHLIGGDYGFAWSMQGTNARDLKFFMDYYGYSAADALLCATRNGGLAMRAQGDLGTLRPGMLADMLLVDGDPLTDVTILTDKRRLAMVMKDGEISTLQPALHATG